MTLWNGLGGVSFVTDTTRTTIETPAMMTTKQNERIAMLEVKVEALKKTKWNKRVAVLELKVETLEAVVERLINQVTPRVRD